MDPTPSSTKPNQDGPTIVLAARVPRGERGLAGELAAALTVRLGVPVTQSAAVALAIRETHGRYCGGDV